MTCSCGTPSCKIQSEIPGRLQIFQVWSVIFAKNGTITLFQPNIIKMVTNKINHFNVNPMSTALQYKAAFYYTANTNHEVAIIK